VDDQHQAFRAEFLAALARATQTLGSFVEELQRE
jgi:hypothetical protein